MVWNHDLSTIDLDKLAALCPAHKLPPSYRYSDGEPGSGCFMDPPGFPSYFVRHVYTSHGNSPSRGASEVLCGRALPPYDYNRPGHVYRAVYKPLPIDHPRTVTWMRENYGHMARCYIDPRKPIATRRNAAELIIWPKTVAERAVCIQENLATVAAIREFYPDHVPNLEWIASPPRGHANWWTRYDHKPAPGEDCPGDRSIRAAHTAERCQFCGVGTGGEE